MDEVLESAPGAACECEVMIQNSQGLHARPAAQFVRIASKYPKVELTVAKGALSVNGKSIIGIMMLAAGPGVKLCIRAHGEGAPALLKDLQQLVDNRFGEDNPG
ncbi:HPr family phosphocarrier protein [soil metagenome]